MKNIDNKFTSLLNECNTYHGATTIFEGYRNYLGNGYCITATPNCENEEEESVEYFLEPLHYYQALAALEAVTDGSLGEFPKEDEDVILEGLKELSL